MSNVLKRFEITINGKSRSLRFNLRALAALQTALEVDELAEALQHILSPRQLAIAVTEGLRHEWQDVTLDDVLDADLEYVSTMKVVSDAIITAMGVKLPEVEADHPPMAESGTGVELSDSPLNAA